MLKAASKKLKQLFFFQKDRKKNQLNPLLFIADFIIPLNLIPNLNPEV